MQATLKKSKSIALPRIPNMPPYAVDYNTGQKGIITLQKAKDIVFAAVLNDDSITIDQDDSKGIVITIIDHDEMERAKKTVEVIIQEKAYD